MLLWNYSIIDNGWHLIRWCKKFNLCNNKPLGLESWWSLKFSSHVPSSSFVSSTFFSSSSSSLKWINESVLSINYVIFHATSQKLDYTVGPPMWCSVHAIRFVARDIAKVEHTSTFYSVTGDVTHNVAQVVRWCDIYFLQHLMNNCIMYLHLNRLTTHGPHFMIELESWFLWR